MSRFTVQDIEQALPPSLRSSATQQLTDKINNLISDPDSAKIVQDNFISYTKVLQEGKFKVEDYLHAVAYVSFKLMGYSNQDAYAKAFPARWANLIASGKTPKDISAYVSAYHKGKLVNLIMEQSFIPHWIVNQDNYQKAINAQVDIMVNGKSEIARTRAADSILNHLKRPDEKGPLVNIDLGNNSGINELRDLLVEVATKQKQAIQSGTSPRDIAAQQIYDVN